MRIKKTAVFRFLFSASYFAVILFYAGFSYGADPMPKEPIVVNGDKVEYFHEKKEVVGIGNISITYKDIMLTCDKITVHLDTREAEAIGNVKVSQKGAYFTGEKIAYNFDLREGKVMDGYVDATPFYGRAKEVEKIANKEQFNMDTGYVTTCDLDHPHYRIQSRRVEIYLEDKIVARHILLFIGKMPVLYLPYYVQPLKDEPKSNMTVMPGESKDWGYYLLTSYRYYFNDKVKGDILLDYRTKKGLAEGVNHYYDTDEIGSGAFKFYYTHENDSLAYEKTGETKSRYRYQFRHRWDFKEQDTIAAVEFNKLSDRDVIKDYFYNEYEELGASPDNYLSVITSKQDYSMEFLVRKRFDKFLTVVERLPEYRIDIFNYNIKNTPIYYKASASGAYLNQKFDNTNVDPEQKDIGAVRFDVYNQLSYAAKLFKALSVTPYGGVRETYYSRNKWGDTNEVRTVFNAGADASIKFYKVYDVTTNFLGLDINQLRHIITPTAGYYYVHQPTISIDNLHQFDAIDSIQAQNGVRLALENRLQTKRFEGGQIKSVDLATLIVSTDYMFRFEKNKLSLKEDKFNNIEFKLELIPFSWAYLTSTAMVNTKRSTVENCSLDLVANGGDKWALAISHRYENVETGKSNLVTMDGTYKINDKWKIRAYERFDAQKGALEEQEYTIYRDLHCWVAEFIYNVKDFKDQTFWFVMRLKAFPDYPIGVKRTYSRPRFGSTGGN